MTSYKLHMSNGKKIGIVVAGNLDIDALTKGGWLEVCTEKGEWCYINTAHIVAISMEPIPDAPSGLDPRDLECQRCGRTYHVDNYDPDSPSGEMCLDCYRELLKKADEAEKEGRL